jgi:plastocyanin
MDTDVILAARRTGPDESLGRPHLWPVILFMMILMGVAVALLGSPTPQEGTPTPTPSSSAEREARVYAISYRFGVFSPTNLRVHAGDTVRWKNDSPLPMRVIAQLRPGEKIPVFDSVGAIQPDSYFSYTFSQAGVYGYHNPSDANESGVIIVRE